METEQVESLADEYTDEKGRLWILAACGHYCGGHSCFHGEKFDMCPNCNLTLRITGQVIVKRPDRLTDKTAKLLKGN